jgi:RNA polymerase sigma-70 factor (ECF subfamily)
MTMMGSKTSANASASVLDETTPDSGPPAPGVPALHDVYKEYVNFVWSSARHLGAAADAIDDVVQDVFIIIHAKLATLQRPESLRSWIYGIVRRTVSDHRRSRRTREAAGARLGAEIKSTHPVQTSPLEMVERSADLDLLEELLAELDEAKREIFVMVEVLEMSVPEVVQALEIPLNTAYSRLRLARQSFEELLTKHEAQSGENRKPCRR